MTTVVSGSRKGYVSDARMGRGGLSIRLVAATKSTLLRTMAREAARGEAGEGTGVATSSKAGGGVGLGTGTDFALGFGEV